ncbi:hypothetical protein CAEBREN_05310 [Caenorhabditis brenneri]|uniref:Uncharacterized protein n=1 Tax=Caenorhabditis brenneri TaxID=135651 RepID=G0MCR7_CAEBE|nr:hypothetical protein CAEBREN_05310 [Caenorhabditis brenneri]
MRKESRRESEGSHSGEQKKSVETQNKENPRVEQATGSAPAKQIVNGGTAASQGQGSDKTVTNEKEEESGAKPSTESAQGSRDEDKKEPSKLPVNMIRHPAQPQRRNGNVSHEATTRQTSFNRNGIVGQQSFPNIGNRVHLAGPNSFQSTSSGMNWGAVGREGLMEGVPGQTVTFNQKNIVRIAHNVNTVRSDVQNRTHRNESPYSVILPRHHLDSAPHRQPFAVDRVSPQLYKTQLPTSGRTAPGQNSSQPSLPNNRNRIYLVAVGGHVLPPPRPTIGFSHSAQIPQRVPMDFAPSGQHTTRSDVLNGRLQGKPSERAVTGNLEKKNIREIPVPVTRKNSPLLPLPPVLPPAEEATVDQIPKRVGTVTESPEKEKVREQYVVEKDAPESGSLMEEWSGEQSEAHVRELADKAKEAETLSRRTSSENELRKIDDSELKQSESRSERIGSSNTENQETDKAGEKPVADAAVPDLALDKIPLPQQPTVAVSTAAPTEAASVSKTQDAEAPVKEASSEPAKTPRPQPQPSFDHPGSLGKETSGEESGVRKEASVSAALSNNPLPSLPSDLQASPPSVPAATAPVSSSCYPVQTIATPQEFALPKTAEIPLPPPRPASTTPEESVVKNAPILSQDNLHSGSTNVARPRIGANTTLLPTPPYPPLGFQDLNGAALRNEEFAPKLPPNVHEESMTGPPPAAPSFSVPIQYPEVIEREQGSSMQNGVSSGSNAAPSAPDSAPHPTHQLPFFASWTTFPEQEASTPAPVGHGSYSLPPFTPRPSSSTSMDQKVETAPAVAQRAASTPPAAALRKLPVLNTDCSFDINDIATPNPSPSADFPKDKLEKKFSDELEKASPQQLARFEDQILGLATPSSTVPSVPSTSGPGPSSTPKEKKRAPKAMPETSERVLRSAKKPEK